MNRKYLVFILTIVLLFSLKTSVYADSVSFQKVSTEVSDSTETNAIDRTDSKYWHFGFYYNPDDPAIFIEKESGLGWTNNMAHPLSWVIMVGILAIIISVIILRRKTSFKAKARSKD